MKRLINLGDYAGASPVRPFHADLDRILSSNLLVQAASGGGKSWLLRRMIEQTFGRVPQLVIDPEGEFSTLRAKFDVVLVGEGGDTPADVRSAGLLAHKLLELGVSAVIDLFEMSPLVRPTWVAAFLQALVGAPKKLWRSLLVYVDEAHMFAPEPGHGAVDSVAHRACRASLVELASRGRKRGFGLVAATQRLGKLSKDFAAELKNVLVGQTFMDVDRERAAGCLGIARADKDAFWRDVKTLAPGKFYALGRALVLEPTLVAVGDVATEHPVAGQKQSAPPPPTETIRHLLPKLADLPKEAEREATTSKELRARVAELEKEIRKADADFADLNRQAREEPAVPPELVELLAKNHVAATSLFKTVTASADKLGFILNDLVGEAEAAARAQDELAECTAEISRLVPIPSAGVRAARSGLLGPTVPGEKIRGGAPAPGSPERRPVPTVSQDGGDYAALPTGGLRRMMVALAQRPGGLTNAQIGVRAGLSSKSGTFSNYLSKGRKSGYISGEGALRYITEVGLAALGDYQRLPEGRDLCAHWVRELGTGGASRMLAALQRAYPGALTHEQLAREADMESSSSGTFSNYVSLLRKLELAEKAGRGALVMSRELAD